MYNHASTYSIYVFIDIDMDRDIDIYDIYTELRVSLSHPHRNFAGQFFGGVTTAHGINSESACTFVLVSKCTSKQVLLRMASTVSPREL
jgi:hypothetical protein